MSNTLFNVDLQISVSSVLFKLKFQVCVPRLFSNLLSKYANTSCCPSLFFLQLIVTCALQIWFTTMLLELASPNWFQIRVPNVFPKVCCRSWCPHVLCKSQLRFCIVCFWYNGRRFSVIRLCLALRGVMRGQGGYSTLFSEIGCWKGFGEVWSRKLVGTLSKTYIVCPRDRF